MTTHEGIALVKEALDVGRFVFFGRWSGDRPVSRPSHARPVASQGGPFVHPAQPSAEPARG